MMSTSKKDKKCIQFLNEIRRGCVSEETTKCLTELLLGQLLTSLRNYMCSALFQLNRALQYDQT